jgi:cellulose synthase/poly-beta-1,6-N-acetylglucosamine synthase-like glycosyltransferase
MGTASAPESSAKTTLSSGQRRAALTAGAALLLALVLAPRPTAVAVVAAVTLFYLASLTFRLHLLRLSLRTTGVTPIDPHHLGDLAAHELPTYTVLIPAFREGERVLRELFTSLDRLDYPQHLLDIKLLLEEDDGPTIAAAVAAGAAHHADIVLVPPGGPRTKPHALNCGLARARGELVTIFDAEDRPEPQQLRKAALVFRHAPPTLGCLQARLGYFNPDQNIITRWFAIEYLMWFSQLLPGLTHLDAPVPLGGTSCHFPRAVLATVGGWDAFNVAEDADLGIRLHRLGYRTAVLDSVTDEEANSHFVNWVKQRSRWYKGYLQTWLVHMRHPRQLWRQLGVRGFARFNLFVGGTPVLALVNPLFWGLTVLWFATKPAFVEAIFPAPIFHVGLLCWLIGNFLLAYFFMYTALQHNRPRLVGAAALVPVYWLMMSLAAVKAVIQLVRSPSLWEKTHHGLDQAVAPPPVQAR